MNDTRFVKVLTGWLFPLICLYDSEYEVSQIHRPFISICTDGIDNSDVKEVRHSNTNQRTFLIG